MSKLRASYNKLNVPSRLSFKRAVAAGVLVLAGCSSVETSGATRDTLSTAAKTSETNTTAPINPQLDPSNVPTTPGKPKFRFDHIAGSTIVKVYADVTERTRGGPHTGTYNSGDIETVDCKMKGRMITPEENQAKRSDQWYRIEGTTQFASEAYGDLVSPDMAAQLPQCPPQ